MLLLAVETATPDTSAALLRGGDLIAEERGAPGRPTAETLLPVVDGLLKHCSVEIDALEGFAVSIGPGSFTSLRNSLVSIRMRSYVVRSKAFCRA